MLLQISPIEYRTVLKIYFATILLGYLTALKLYVNFWWLISSALNWVDDIVIVFECFGVGTLTAYNFYLTLIDRWRDQFVDSKQIDHSLESMSMLETNLTALTPIDGDWQL